MIGCYDFCGHYEWTFEWLRRQGGDSLVREYWATAIGGDSQRHAAVLIQEKGFEGMAEYWSHTLAEEEAGYIATKTEDVFRIDMHDCPSKGFLLRNGLEQYSDYCDHCIGWIGPVMKEAGFQVHHEHNHCGKCWWEFRRAIDPSAPSEIGGLSAKDDVRSHPDWAQSPPADVFRHATNALDKAKPQADGNDRQDFQNI